MPDNKKTSVLIVEDEEILAHSVARLLRRHGFAPRVCHDGHTALQMAQEATCDVAITDWCVPGLAGRALIEGLLSANRACRVVVVSADLTGPGEYRSPVGGILPCLPKPFTLEALLQHVRGETPPPTPMAWAG